jgi:methionyl-tRNA formyltransferase
MNPNFLFIGGTNRGYRVLTALLLQGYLPKKCFILKEDDHEDVKVAEEISLMCKKHNIDCSIRKKLLDEDDKYIMANQFDFAVVCGWRTIINPKLIKNFGLGLIAAHDSLLPKYRGFAPINWCIINGEKKTGVTLFLIDEGEVDSGPVISQREIVIKPDEYAIDVYEKVTNTTIELYTEFFSTIASGAKVILKVQDEQEASYTCKRTPTDGKIDWNEKSDIIINLIRGIAHPYPGAYCYFNSTMYHIRKAVLGKSNMKNYSGRIPGRVINISGDGIEVLCGQGSVLIQEWEDKKGNNICIPSENIKSITATLS